MGRFPVAGEGYPFILASFLCTIIVWFAGGRWLTALTFLVTLFVLAFFRDPEREVPPGEDSIVSPADGRVVKVERVRDDRFLKGEALKISVFMSLFNVHVNRVPASGRVFERIYNPGRFFSANLDKASTDNEQNALIIEGPQGRTYAVNQIAGLIARRIVCYPTEGAELKKGERFGIIMFGSRCDVFLPAGAKEAVRRGDRVKAGSSIIGYW